MKNKHLVLLFLLTLFVGLAVRRAPWLSKAFFQADLLRLDTARVQEIQIALPGQPMLFLQRNDEGWSAEQGERNARVPSIFSDQILAALADLRSIRIAKSPHPDTLGFTPATVIEVGIQLFNGRSEQFKIGWETIENSQPATFVQLPKHEGVYLTNNHLRGVFSKTLNDFRNPRAFKFSPLEVRGFAVFGPNLDSLFFQKNDSAHIWQNRFSAQTAPNDSVQIWLGKLARVKNLPFADYFDESHARQTFYAQINLEFSGQMGPLTLKIFRLKQQNMPEELPLKKPNPYKSTPFVLHSSQNPTNYFAIADTGFVRQICRPSFVIRH